MLKDKYGRIIDYLRVSVTDKCNYRCTYCMPLDGVPLKPHSEILRYEQIEQIARKAAALGVKRVRITGGEPLVKKNIEHLVKLLADISGIDEVSMTTNGSLLTADMAKRLKAEGLSRVNISLDTLDPPRFKSITRGGDMREVLQGIDAAKAVGLLPVKINMVVFEDTTQEDVELMRQFCKEKDLKLQTIRQFSLYDRGPSNYSIETERPPRCDNCNRLRLTADGHLKPCLFSDQELKVDFPDIRGSILAAVEAKPQSGASCRKRTMSQIGG